MAHEENLIPLNRRTPEERKKITSAGGNARVKAIKRRKMMSQIYGEMLADRYEVSIKGEKKKIPGDKFFKAVAKEILTRKDASSVAMLKEIREATEGNKMNLLAQIDAAISTPDDRLEEFNKLKAQADINLAEQETGDDK